ncbi:hypothetical protein GCM10009087_21860 [Sphingomonas oligophenolica]|uniref:DUF6151 family protein n=1 Tax=Sphingomonas oligophenolica TaxID=301154 RepID=A0ABU9Y3J6_9SPHN
MSMKTAYRSSCSCGQVMLEATGEPILSAACYCTSCQAAARRFEQARGAPPVLRSDGGTDYCLFRKDRVRVTRGGEQLQEHRLTEESATRRLVAACCNAPMVLDFTRGHWLTLYRDRLSQDAPPVEMGLMAKDRPADRPLPDGLPIYEAYPARFMIRIMIAWARMGFRRPRLTW